MDSIKVCIEHRWRYFVNIESKAVRSRECESCGSREVVSRVAERAPAGAIALPPAAA